MSRAVRLLGAMALACASVPLTGVGTAQADASVLMASNSAYFNATGVDKPAESPAAPPNVPSLVADGVAAENLAVAAKGGSEDKVSFLYFDVFGVPAGSTITKAIVSMPLVPNDPQNISAQAAPEKVQACKAGDAGFSGDDGAAIATSAPERLCAAFKAVGKASADSKSYEFDITGLAKTWTDGANDGVAFTRADDAAGSNFQVVFAKGVLCSLALTYTPPVETPTAPTDSGTGTDTGAGTGSGFDGGTGFTGTPDTGSGGGFGVDTAPELGGEIVPPEVSPPAAGTKPTVAGQASTPVAVVSPSMRPTAGFWIAALVIAAALAVLSLIFGDPRVPTEQTARSRLSNALAQRERQGLRGGGLRTQPS